MNWNPFRKKDQDWSKFFGEQSNESRKERLIRLCNSQNVSIYIDDQSETAEGIYAALRAVASEAELERRLNTQRALAQSKYSNYISLIALGISIGSFVLALIAMGLL
jgi:hypothetical protein